MYVYYFVAYIHDIYVYSNTFMYIYACMYACCTIHV